MFGRGAVATSGDVAVTASDLSVTFPGRKSRDSHRAVRGVSFELAAGEILGVVGESGSGKTTLAKTIAGLAGGSSGGDGIPEITGGDVTVFGQSMRTITRRRRTRLTFSIGYIAQDAGQTLDPQLTIGENIAEPIFSRDRRFDQREAGKRVYTLVDAVALPSAAIAKFPHELSSGQRQRAAIARSLMLGPKLLIADEPTAGIDVMSRAAVLDLILELQRRGRFSAIVVSHDLAVAARLAQSVVVLSQGVVVGLGPIDEVLATPEHPYVAGLAASRNETGDFDELDTTGSSTVLSAWEHRDVE